MSEDFKILIRDTLTYFKEALQTKQVNFASQEEWAFFQKFPENKPKVLAEKPVPLHQETVVPSSPPKTSNAKPFLKPTVQQKPEVNPPSPQQVAPIPSPPAPSSAIQKTLQHIAPHLKLVNEVPDDQEAKHKASAWKEKIPDVEVVLIACDTQTDTLELLKSLAKAIDQNLAKSKVISADRLEREKRWDLFLTQNSLRLLIASSGLKSLADLMRHYRAHPATNQHFLDQTPLLILSEASLYKSLEHKALLWKTLCQMLKK